MICFPNCKINLGLFITHRRDDGYHDLETIFYPISPAEGDYSENVTNSQVQFTKVLNDVLEVVPTTSTPQLHLSGLSVAGDKNKNLVWRAYQLLMAEFPGKVPPLNVYLHKTTPMGAGLGGGSANGAYMLRLLNDYCALNLSSEELASYALQLGSDCPFFIYNTPQYATGRGEQLQPINVNLSGYSIKVVCSDLHVSTKEAFADIIPRPTPFNLQNITNLPITEWKHHIVNDFEATVFKVHPQLAATKEQLYAMGAVYASMTGTGSAVYGIFENDK